MPYYNSSDPQGMQQASGNPWYNPLSPYTNLGGGIQYLLAQMAGQKEQKKQAEWDIEDRDLNTRYKNAQISNLYETTPPKATKIPSNVTPKMVKSFMGRLDYPQEAIEGVDSLTPEDLFKTWEDVQAAYNRQVAAGKKVPKTAPSQVGKQHLAKLKLAIDRVEKRKAPFTAALSQLWGNPDKMIGSEQHVKWLQEENNKIDEQASTIALLAQEVDETGELSEESQKKLDSILRFRSMYRAPQKKTYADGPSGRIWTTDGITWYNEKTGLPVK
jgi:hypothetical protein